MGRSLMFQAHSQKRSSSMRPAERSEGLDALHDARVVAPHALVQLEQHQVADHHFPPLAAQVMKSPTALAASEMPWKPIWT